MHSQVRRRTDHAAIGIGDSHRVAARIGAGSGRECIAGIGRPGEVRPVQRPLVGERTNATRHDIQVHGIAAKHAGRLRRLADIGWHIQHRHAARHAAVRTGDDHRIIAKTVRRDVIQDQDGRIL